MYGNLNKANLARKILIIACYAVMINGIYWVLVMFIGRVFGMYDIMSGYAGLIIAQSAGFLVFIYIAVTMLLLKLKSKKKNPVSYYAVMIIGFAITAAFTMPIVLTPLSVTQSESEFAAAFGEDWEKKIPTSVKEKYFLKTPFNLAQYFLGTPHKDCIIKQDVFYYDGENITLYFDVYMPREPSKDLPGKGSVIIKIHGGAWSLGQKSIWNMLAVNKYLASQGYIIFDIE